MAKSYRTTTGLVRYGMGLPDAAKDLSKSIKLPKRSKCKTYKYYKLYYFDDDEGQWSYYIYSNLKKARYDLRKFKRIFRDAFLAKVTVIEEEVL